MAEANIFDTIITPGPRLILGPGLQLSKETFWSGLIIAYWEKVSF